MRPVRLHLIAFANFRVLTEQHDADLAFFKIQRQSHDAVRKLQKLAGHDLFQTVDPCNTVADRNHGADFADIDAGAISFDLFADDLADFVCFNLHSLPFTLRSGGS